MQFLRVVDQGVTIALRVQPGARKSAILGVWGEGAPVQLKVAVQAPPVEGKANAALVEFLARFFAVSRARVELMHGELNRSKVFLLRGLSLSDAEARLREALSD